MRILLAGGAGFLGSHLALRFLAEGHETVILDNFLTGRWANVDRAKRHPNAHQLTVVTADVCRLPPLRGCFDAILHLASPASPGDYLRWPLETLEAGSTGTRNLLERAQRDGARFLLASTSEVYGDPQVHPQPESYWGHVNPVGPRSVYDEAKRFAESLATAYARHTDVAVRIARIFNTYGPGMRLEDGRIIPTFVQEALRGDALTVHGDGAQTRSYCYVDDLVEGLHMLLWSEVRGPVNLGNDAECTVLETARRVITLTGSSSRITHHPLPQDDPRVRRPDLARARRELGWTPRVGLEEGLGRTIADVAERIRDARGIEEARIRGQETKGSRAPERRESRRPGRGARPAAYGRAG